MKIISLVTISLLIGLTGCSLNKAIEDQQALKVECQDLKPVLDDLGSKALSSVIVKKVENCKDHGFWPKTTNTYNRRTRSEFLDVED